VTDVRWLPPTAANVAKTMITIPPGSIRRPRQPTSSTRPGDSFAVSKRAGRQASEGEGAPARGALTVVFKAA
jgi:hypothetical protein